MSSHFPSGSVKKFRSTDRYDMNIFQHFNHTHGFFRDDYDSATALTHQDVEDIDKVGSVEND